MTDAKWKKLVADKVPVTWIPLRAQQYEREDTAAIAWGMQRWVRYTPTTDPRMHGYELAIKVPPELEAKINAIPFDDGGGGIIIHRSDHKKAAWQITYLNGAGKPWSHEYRDLLQEAIDDVRAQCAVMLGPRAARYQGVWIDAVVSMDEIEDVIVRIAQGGAIAQEGVAKDIGAYLQQTDAPPKDEPKTRSNSAIHFATHYEAEGVARFCDKNSRCKGWDMHYHPTDGLMAFMHVTDRTLEISQVRGDPFKLTLRMMDGDEQLALESFDMEWVADSEQDAKAVGTVFRRFLKKHQPKDAKRTKKVRKGTSSKRLRGALV